MNDSVKKVGGVLIEEVPIEKSFRKKDGKWQEILKAMEVGQSFVIDETEDKSMSQMTAIRASAKGLGMKVRGIKISEHARRVQRTE